MTCESSINNSQTSYLAYATCSTSFGLKQWFLWQPKFQSPKCISCFSHIHISWAKYHQTPILFMLVLFSKGPLQAQLSIISIFKFKRQYSQIMCPQANNGKKDGQWMAIYLSLQVSLYFFYVLCIAHTVIKPSNEACACSYEKPALQQ